ncbi:MAG TPA: hypothetical protein VKY85_15980 [Candidatus Angelobacter sp.]|nr:hypothetical protein [Candidatus Angelobacter sp.]
MNSRRVTLAILFALACVSCNKSPSPKPQSMSPASTSVASRDYSAPYLTDDKMQKFLQSMSEAQNPFEGMFAQAGKTPGSIPAEVAALDAFARKYGFQGYQDYMAVWGRIAVGEMSIMAEGMKKGLREMTEKSIQSAQEQLKNPSLSPEMRKVYEQQITSGQQSLQNMDKPQKNSLNDSDLALVRKYSPQIEEASRRYNKRPTQGQ